MRRVRVKIFPVAFALAVVFCGATAVRGQSTRFKRGDANADARVDVSDAVSTLNHLFLGRAGGPCEDAADANDDGQLDVSDAVYSLAYLFLGGSEPASPGFQCGVDPTPDALGCDHYPACSQDGTLSPLLKPTGDCEEVVSQLRQSLVESMEATLDSNLQMALELAQNGGCLPWARDVWFFGPNVLADVEGAGPEEEESAEEYSETNTQVAGVDEADFIKNDGGYIYILADGELQIIDAWPAPDAHTLAAVEIEGTPKKLFVHEDRAVVYSSLEPLVPPFDDPWGMGRGMWIPTQYGECTYGYDCEFTGDGRRLKVTAFDISDRSNPTLLREIEFSGSYLNSRRIGDLVYTVVIFPEVIVPAVRYWPEELENYWEFCWWDGPDRFPYTAEDVLAMFAELRESNLAVIEAASITDFLPSIREIRYDGETPVTREELLQDCEDFYISQAGDGHSLISLVSFQIDVVADPAATTIMGRPGAVYASQDSLYIATRHYGWEMDRWYFDSRERIPEATTIHKFRLFYDETGTTYIGSGLVKGRVLNQFSMDERQGHLRVATTTGHVPSPDVHSTLSVLAENEGNLELVGQVDDIAPTEDIRSVRFNGEIAFLVTFKKTDPLFVIDCADPSSPFIRGELKIPGYSTYMHLLDDRHILAIGFDADDQGDFAWFQGILLQIFDVGDLDNPSLLHREVIGTRGTTSDAATNHLAFNYFRARSLLGLPIVVCEGGAGGGFGDEISFSGLMVYRVDLEQGFELLGGVPHATPEGDARVSCGNWWTQANSQVKRSVFMDDYVYSVALDQINISHVEDLEHPVASISLVDG